MNATFLTVLGFLLLFHGGHFYAVDNYTVFISGNALLEGMLAIPKGLGTVVGSDGRSYSMYPIGLSLLFAPFAAVGSLLDSLYPATFATVAGPSVSIFYPETFAVFAASLVTPLFGAFAAAVFLGTAEVLYTPPPEPLRS